MPAFARADRRAQYPPPSAAAPAPLSLLFPLNEGRIFEGVMFLRKLPIVALGRFSFSAILALNRRRPA